MSHTSTWNRSNTSKNNNKFVFDLEALKLNDKKEIKRVGENFHKLNQRQKDLIRHNTTPDIFKELRMISDRVLEATESIHERSFDSFDSLGSRHTSFNNSVNSSGMSREEKRDSRDAADRQHEREVNTQKEMHKETMSTLKSITLTVTAGVAVAGAAVYIFNKSKD